MQSAGSRGGEEAAAGSVRRRYEAEVLAVWQQLFYLQRLKDGDHLLQARAPPAMGRRGRRRRERWRRRRAGREGGGAEAAVPQGRAGGGRR